MRKFHDNEHANNRLSRCYAMCRIDGKWDIRRIDGASTDTIIVNCGARFRMTDEDNIKFLFPSLGYVNTYHQCIYLSRKSRRLWKVGIVPDNLSIEPIFPNYITHRDEINNSEALKKLFLNEYPTPKEALDDVLNGQAAARAFSKKFCFGLHAETKEVVLYYQNMPLGHYDKSYKAIMIGDVNSHLIQPFVEASGGVFEVLV